MKTQFDCISRGSFDPFTYSIKQTPKVNIKQKLASAVIGLADLCKISSVSASDGKASKSSLSRYRAAINPDKSTFSASLSIDPSFSSKKEGTISRFISKIASFTKDFLTPPLSTNDYKRKLQNKEILPEMPSELEIKATKMLNLAKGWSAKGINFIAKVLAPPMSTAEYLSEREKSQKEAKLSLEKRLEMLMKVGGRVY